jgi:hypothetical protein
VSPSASSSDALSREPAQTAREASLQAACPRHLTSTDFRSRSTCLSRPSRCVEATALHTRGPSLSTSEPGQGRRPGGCPRRARGGEKQSQLLFFRASVLHRMSVQRRISARCSQTRLAR